MKLLTCAILLIHFYGGIAAQSEVTQATVGATPMPGCTLHRYAMHLRCSDSVLPRPSGA